MADRPERDNRRGGRKGRRKVCSFAVLFLKEARSSPEELRELVHIISVA